MTTRLIARTLMSAVLLIVGVFAVAPAASAAASQMPDISVSLPEGYFADLVVGCYDYDPFASFLPFPVIMIRQDVEGMITKAFDVIEEARPQPRIHLIQPELVQPRTALTGPLDALKDIE